MFTGIIKETAVVEAVKPDKGNLLITLRSALARKFKVNDSVAHNGVCLSVMPLTKHRYRVTAVQETLRRTTLRRLRAGMVVNLERSMKASSRFNGHFVLGHADATLKCISVKKLAGSHLFTFSYKPECRKFLVAKGSIALNGVSLTIAALTSGSFSVAIIPFTFKHTNFQSVKPGAEVNAEFDVLGKYVLNKLVQRA